MYDFAITSIIGCKDLTSAQGGKIWTLYGPLVSEAVCEPHLNAAHIFFSMARKKKNETAVTDHLVVEGWMVERFPLITERLVFARIYAFNKAGLTYYESAEKLASWAGISLRHLRNVLPKMVSDGALKKTGSQGVKCIYSAVPTSEMSSLVTNEEIAQVDTDNKCNDCTTTSEMSSLDKCNEFTSHLYNNLDNKADMSYKKPNAQRRPQEAEVAAYAERLGFRCPEGFAAYFIQVCDRNGWRTQNGQGQPIVNWKTYMAKAWAKRKGDYFASPAQAETPATYRIVSKEEFSKRIQ